MSFESPKDQRVGFKAPEEDIIKPSETAPEPTFLDKLHSTVSRATKAAVAPISAISEPIAGMVANTVNPPPETVEQANARGVQHPSQNALDYERSSNYPPEGMTTLSPSLDVAFAAQAGKDIAGFGLKTLAKNKAKKDALEAFIKESKQPLAEGVPTAPISAEPAAKAVEDIIPTTTPKIEAYVKGSMGGGISPNTGKPLPKINIYGVRGDKTEIAKLGFGDDPASIPEDVLKKAGIPLPGESKEAVLDKALEIKTKPPVQLEFPTQNPSKGITFNARQTGEIEKELGSKVPKVEPSFGSPTTGAKQDISPKSTMVPKTEQAKLIERAANDEMKEPISPPSTPKPESPLLPGAEQRIKAFSEVPSNTIDPRNPLTSRAELNKKVGQLEKTATDQWLAGVDAENKAIEAGLKAKQGLRQVTKIQPDTLESQALFHFIENPNKMEALGKLNATVGKDVADDIAKAENYIRTNLDAVLPEVNKVRAVNGLPPIKYRENYVTHMNEMNVLSTLNKLDLLGTEEGATIAKGIAGADAELAKSNPSLYSKLKEVVFPYVQRKNEEHATDAINAFDRYMDNAHRYIQTQPYVNELINSASAVESKNPNLANYLRQQANYIAGGRSPIDKAAEMIVDKDLIKLASQLQNNAKGNVITLNPSVPITQLFGLTSTVGKYPLRDSLLATMKSFADPELQKFALAKSPVLQTRALQASGNALNVGKITSASQKLIAWFDYKVAEISWMSAFKNAIRTKPLDEALNDANAWAAITQSHQGRVSTSPMMQSQVVQTVLPLMNQQVAAARSLLLHTFQGKSLAGKGLAAGKILAYGAAVAALKSAVTGREDNPLSPTNILPFGGVLERGMGGPVFNAASRMATAKSQEDLVRQTIRAAFLLQNKIPGGATVGRQVENAFMGEPKKRKK